MSGKFLVVLFDLSDPRRKSNHGFLGVDSEGGIRQVKESRIYLLVQQYKQYSIPENESIDIGFAKFNIRVTSLKALDESFSSKNYVRKFLRALHLKWRANVTTIEESKDLSSLSLNGLIGNLKVHEMIIEKDSELVGGKRKKIKSLAMRLKKSLVMMSPQCLEMRMKSMLWRLEILRNSLGEEIDSLGNHMMIRNHSKSSGMIGKGKVSEIALDVEVQITSSKNIQYRQDIRTKKPLSEVLGAISMRSMKKRQTTKRVLWLNANTFEPIRYWGANV
ncbi:hypothetical protein Tco_0703795 [Tanacetum coccineum]|uniref:UBN2 domain-containing protein n=1 Tax=Tanacetum coccineum TaxID=301880 RepID=A0ABQ4Y0D8_9ASTR